MGKDLHVPFLESYHGAEMKNGKALGIKCALKKKLFSDSDFIICIATGKSVKEGHNKHLDDIGIKIECKENIGWEFSSHHNGHWGQVERVPLNVVEEHVFYMRVEPHSNHFKIFINGEKIHEFRFQVPLDYLNTVYADGNIRLLRVLWETNTYMVPFMYRFYDLRPGKSIYITGVPEKNSVVFNINLEKDEHNIPLTISVRMESRHKNVVRNTMKNGKWLDEEVFADNNQAFPFADGVEFQLQIELKQSGLEVIINGRRYCEYYYREPLESIRRLHINGDLELKSVDM